MAAIEKIIKTVLHNANRAELELMKNGDIAVATWLLDKCFTLTPEQNEAVAFRIIESLDN